MQKNKHDLQIVWRDENYGSVCAVAAFRTYGTVGLPLAKKTKIRGIAKRAGFKFDNNRASWICDKGEEEQLKNIIQKEMSEHFNLINN